MNRLNSIVSYYAPYSDFTASHTRGMRYLVFVEGIKGYFGRMNTFKEGRRVRKHIIVRRAPNARRLHQLYTYHFPKSWSAACVANRELIKEAQRRAHALEHAHTPEAHEWNTRFLIHYFKVIVGGEKPAPGMKRYSRFYQYTYVAILRQLKEQQRQALQLSEDVSFDPINISDSLSHSFAHTPLRAITRRVFLPTSVDESFILKPVACFSG